MRGLAAVTCAIVMDLAAGAADACTATSMVDRARASKDSDQYRAARDVAETFIDTEKYIKNDATLEAGTGALFTEVDGRYGTTVPNDGRSASDWESIMGKTTYTNHGRSADGRSLSNSALIKNVISVRDHMRMHVWEWHDAFNGGNPALLDMWTKGWTPVDFTGSKYTSPVTSGPAPAPSNVEGPTPIRPVPVTPIPGPAPVAPVPTVDHAG